MRDSTVIDMLCQFAFDDFRRPGGPLGQKWLRDPRTFTAEDFAQLRDSGVSMLALGSGPGSYDDAMRYAQWNGFIASNSQWFTRIDDATDLRSVKASGKVGVMLTAQISDHFRTAADVNTFYGMAHVHGLNHPKRVFDLTEAMVQRKHSDANIRLLLGGSFTRVLTDVWE